MSLVRRTHAYHEGTWQRCCTRRGQRSLARPRSATAAAAAGATFNASPVAGVSEARASRPTRLARRFRAFRHRGAATRAVPALCRRSSSFVSPAGQAGAAQRALAVRGARGVILGTRAVRGAGRWRAWGVGQPVRPSLSRSPGRLRAKPARSAAQRSPRDPPGLARGESCGPSCSITVAPSRWRLPAQAASAKSEAQRGGHGGWRTAWPTRGGAACRAAWLGKHPGSLEAATSDHLLDRSERTSRASEPLPTWTYLNLPTSAVQSVVEGSRGGRAQRGRPPRPLRSISRGRSAGRGRSVCRGASWPP